MLLFFTLSFRLWHPRLRSLTKVWVSLFQVGWACESRSQRYKKNKFLIRYLSFSFCYNLLQGSQTHSLIEFLKLWYSINQRKPKTDEFTLRTKDCIEVQVWRIKGLMDGYKGIPSESVSYHNVWIKVTLLRWYIGKKPKNVIFQNSS